MSTTTDISITINYQLFGSKEWVSVGLLPGEYFDLDEGEEIVWDCVPLHNHAIEYLNIDNLNIRSTKLNIRDSQAQVTRLITETFWNNGKNRAMERFDTGPGINDWELVLKIRISDMPLIWEILRLDKMEGILIPNYHGFIQRNEDGSETEIKVKDGSHKP
jgi:hypothetical protein